MFGGFLGLGYVEESQGISDLHTSHNNLIRTIQKSTTRTRPYLTSSHQILLQILTTRSVLRNDFRILVQAQELTIGPLVVVYHVAKGVQLFKSTL
jgi:hypothetical protein